MKKIIQLSIILLFSLPLFAQFGTENFMKIKEYGSIIILPFDKQVSNANEMDKTINSGKQKHIFRTAKPGEMAKMDFNKSLVITGTYSTNADGSKNYYLSLIQDFKMNAKEREMPVLNYLKLEDHKSLANIPVDSTIMAQGYYKKAFMNAFVTWLAKSSELKGASAAYFESNFLTMPEDSIVFFKDQLSNDLSKADYIKDLVPECILIGSALKTNESSENTIAESPAKNKEQRKATSKERVNKEELIRERRKIKEKLSLTKDSPLVPMELLQSDSYMAFAIPLYKTVQYYIIHPEHGMAFTVNLSKMEAENWNNHLINMLLSKPKKAKEKGVK